MTTVADRNRTAIIEHLQADPDRFHQPQAIAHALDLSPGTVRRHLEDIKRNGLTDRRPVHGTNGWQYRYVPADERARRERVRNIARRLAEVTGGRGNRTLSGGVTLELSAEQAARLLDTLDADKFAYGAAEGTPEVVR